MKNKFLIETSAARAAVGPSTKAQEEAYLALTSSGETFSSYYIRMEFIRRWICIAIKFTVLIKTHGSLKEAIVRAEQSFKPREVKAYAAFLADYLDRRNAHSSEEISEEVARCAYHWLRRFDNIFKSNIPNKSHCERGGMPINVRDFSTIVEDLHLFAEKFQSPVMGCKVNHFLRLNDKRSIAHGLIDKIDDSKYPTKAINKILEKQKAISCRECETIGDLVICLEQTKQYVLIHVDGSFDHLCELRNMKHAKLPSVTACDNAKRDSHP